MYSKLCIQNSCFFTDDDLENALEDSNSETILRKFFEGTSATNDDFHTAVLCVTFVTLPV